MSRTPRDTVAAIRKAFDDGRSNTETAAALSISTARVLSALRGHPPWLEENDARREHLEAVKPLIVADMRAGHSLREAAAAHKVSVEHARALAKANNVPLAPRGARPVPGWVPETMHRVYRDTAREKDEFAAAKLCREMKARRLPQGVRA